MTRACVLVLLLSARATFACEPDAEFVAMQASDGAQARVFISLPPPPVSKPFDIVLDVCGAQAATVAVAAVMPAHKHGMNYTPTVTARADGRFDVSGMVFHMPGSWQIEVDVAIADNRETHTLLSTAQ